MSKSKTVTLIDLEGKVHRTLDLTDSVTLANLRTDVYYNKPAYREPYHSDIDLREQLVAFLNHQQTLICKGLAVGHFNDLLIYQATLGKYWEVPWIINPSIPIAQTEEIIYHKDGNRVKPKREYFLKHYPDVFSNLPAWKGE